MLRYVVSDLIENAGIRKTTIYTVKKLLIISLLISCQQLVWASVCPDGNLTLRRQEDVDHFAHKYPNCTHLRGTLIIRESSPGAIRSLNGLRQLRSIGGDLLIVGNTELSRLAGLENITSIAGSLRIHDNIALLTVEELTALRAIAGELSLVDNSALRSLAGIERLDPQSIHAIRILNSPQLSVCTLPTLCGFLDYGRPLEISGNAAGCLTASQLRAACSTQAQVLKLASFSVNTQTDRALLKWKTATEINNAGFEIQRSVDGRRWEAIGWQMGQGTMFNECNYEHLDNHPHDGTNYYRIKQVDFDGISHYTPILSLLVDRAETVEFYPNPTTDKLIIRGCDLSWVRITDQAGRVVREMPLSGPEVDVSELRPGIYNLLVSGHERKIVGRICKT